MKMHGESARAEIRASDEVRSSEEKEDGDGCQEAEGARYDVITMMSGPDVRYDARNTRSVYKPADGRDKNRWRRLYQRM